MTYKPLIIYEHELQQAIDALSRNPPIYAELAAAKYILRAVQEREGPRPMAYVFRDMAGIEYCEIGATPPRYAQTNIVTLYALPEPPK